MKLNPYIFPLVTVALGAAALWVNGSETEWKLPPDTSQFQAGEGVGIAVGQCLICHSADYVSTQPPLDRAGWTASVNKMREKYGAPLPDSQVEPLVNYLVTTYGTEKGK